MLPRWCWALLFACALAQNPGGGRVPAPSGAPRYAVGVVGAAARRRDSDHDGPAGEVACHKATPYAKFTAVERFELCSGAASDAPARCAAAAPHRLKAAQAIALCRGAVTIAASRCAGAAPRAFTPAQAVALCRSSGQPRAATAASPPAAGQSHARAHQRPGVGAVASGGDLDPTAGLGPAQCAQSAPRTPVAHVR